MQWRLFSLVKPFKAPAKSFDNLDAEVAGKLIAAASDVTLVLDGRGVITDIAFQSDELAAALGEGANWIGQRWLQTVRLDSQPKIEALLAQSSTAAPTRWRQVNHPWLRWQRGRHSRRLHGRAGWRSGRRGRLRA